MGTPAADNRNRTIVILVVIVVVLLVALAFFGGLMLARSSNPGPVSAKASPSPTATITPSASPSTGPSPTASTVQALSSSGTLLEKSSGSDTGEGRGNGPGCQIWVDPGWTLGDCSLVPVNGDDAGKSVAYVTEHKTGPGGVQWRIFIMTTSATEGFWHTRLYHSDDQGGGFTNITVKAVDTTGGGRPDLVVGFRHNKTSGGGTVLDYDIIQRASATAPLQVVAHRQIADGSVVFGPGITDYDSSPGPGLTKSVIGYSNGGFRITSSTQVPAGSAPASQLP